MIVLYFWCENCPGKEHALEVTHHKGETHLEWRT
jgi:hypothetical protein